MAYRFHNDDYAAKAARVGPERAESGKYSDSAWTAFVRDRRNAVYKLAFKYAARDADESFESFMESTELGPSDGEGGSVGGTFHTRALSAAESSGLAGELRRLPYFCYASAEGAGSAWNVASDVAVRDKMFCHVR